MTFKQLNKYLLSKQGVTFDYPFDEKVRVYRIGEKMFALTSEDRPISVNLKVNRTNKIITISQNIRCCCHTNR